MTWARYLVHDQDSGQLSLGLKLSEADLPARKLINDYIPHSNADMKSLWDRWDQARVTPEPPVFSIKIGFAAFALLSIGVNLHWVWPTAYRPLGIAFWFGGVLLAVGQILHFFKIRKASR